MKKASFILAILFATFLFAGCSDNDTSTGPALEYVKVNLQIGTDSTLDLSGNSTPFIYSAGAKSLVKGNPLTITRSSDIVDFVPVIPTTFTAYLVASQDLYTSEGQAIITKGTVLNSITVHTGSNYISVPKYGCNIYVTNYSDGTETQQYSWITWKDPLDHLPAGTTKLYLYGKNEALTEEENDTYGEILTGEVKMSNPYAAVCVYKNAQVTGYPTDWSGTVGLSGAWYYIYKNCSKGLTDLGLIIPLQNNQQTYLSDEISANHIYQYVIYE